MTPKEEQAFRKSLHDVLVSFAQEYPYVFDDFEQRQLLKRCLTEILKEIDIVDTDDLGLLEQSEIKENDITE